MSLLLWLPFVKGNCKNQGLLDVETSTLGTINYEDGKLGKAVRIGNGTAVTNGIQINTNLVEEFGDEYSCSVWVKPTGSHVHYEGAILSSGNWNNKKWAFGIGQNNTTIDPLGPGYNYRLACEIPINEWTHLVSTVKNNIATVYKNGELVGTIDFGSLVLESDALNTTIGRETYANGYFSFNGCIQDMRIYNHCLSRREIKELSKGLVLHYPLAMPGNENLLPHTSISDYGLGYMTSYYGFGSVSVDNDFLYNGGPTIKIKPSSSSTSTGGVNKYGDSVNLVAGETYTYSCMIYSTVADTFTHNSLGHYQTYTSSAAHNRREKYNSDTIPANTWTKVRITFTVNTDCLFYSFFIYFENTSQEIHICQVKLEKGDYATPWLPSPADTAYSSMGLDDNVIYDVSGYGHNGMASGITYSADTARYIMSTSFDGVNDYINIGSDVGHLFDGSPFSICFWIKSMENTTRGIIFSGYGLPSTSNFFSLEINSSSPTYCNNNLRFDWKSNPDIYSSNDMIPYNQWAHIAVTYDGSNTVSMYKNGQLFSTKSSPLLSIDFGNNYYLGKDIRTGTTAFNGLMSDFRIYATCLSADDIKALYQIPISLSSDGTLFASEYVEG